MAKETREQKVARLIEKHIKDRNMDPKSITDHYSLSEFGFALDPDYFEARLNMGWGFFKDEPRHLDHMTRQIIISTLLAFRNRPGCYHQGKKGIMMGVTYEQMLEAYEVGQVPGGGPLLMNGMEALRRMSNEGIKPGQQTGPWAGKWVQLGSPTAAKKKDEMQEPANPSETREEKLIRMIEKYNPDEKGEMNKDLAFGAKMDPDFFEGYARIAWGIFEEKECHLDPIRREMAMLLVMAFQGMSDDVYIHCKKALSLGATKEQLLEAFEVGFTGGGSKVLLEGLHALRRIDEEESLSKKKGKK